MSQSHKSQLARLVLFTVCVSIAGSLMAGTYYFAVDLPQQKAVHAPQNSGSDNSFCNDECTQEMYICIRNCPADILNRKQCSQECGSKYGECQSECDTSRGIFR